ncbi:tyrosine-type recombinase/integrase [Mycolicibacter sinensis]
MRHVARTATETASKYRSYKLAIWTGPAAAAMARRIVRQKANIDYRLHDLRHFYASGLIAAGCDAVTVQQALGHSSASVTLDTYGHLWPDANDRTRKAAAGLVEQALGCAADGYLKLAC